MTETGADDISWSEIEKIVFRFSFILLLLFITFYNNGAYLFFEYLIYYPTKLLHSFIPWFAKTFLKLPGGMDVSMNGSGDTTYYYVLLLVITVVSALGCLIWSALDKKNCNYKALLYWLTVAVRFYLGFMLINYGLVKVIKLQFPFPDLYRLGSTYGESSPMGLAWTFLGFSTGYNLFMGVAELMGFLLFFRRTVTLGAIIALMTTANVMAVNYFYDVPVKILSTALVLMSIYLLAPNFKRLYSLFVAGKAIGLRIMEPPPIKWVWLANARPAIKLMIIFVPFLLALMMVISRREHYSRGPKPPLYGIYEVTSFEWKKDSLASPVYALPWKKLMIETRDRSAVSFADGSRDFCKIKVDTITKMFDLTLDSDVSEDHRFKYSVSQVVPNREKLTLKGNLFGNEVVISFTKQKMTLVETGFNWINERPNNR